MWGVFLINVHTGCKIQTCIKETKSCHFVFSCFKKALGGLHCDSGAVQINLTCFVICAETKKKKKTHTHTNTQAHMCICGTVDYMSRQGRDGWMEERGGFGERLSRTTTSLPASPLTDSQLPSPSTPSCNLHSSTGSLKPCVRPPPTNYLATLPLSPAQAWCCCMMGFLYIEFHLLVR